jgi:AcrR family transcriptional regulator
MDVSEKRQRRTQAERSATTRTVLLESTIKCLYEHGYGSTTTINVAEEAGVSRGAMLHQFPSKADLMAFVVEETFAEEVELYHALLEGIDDPRDRLLAYPEATWKVLSRPAGVAVLEIMQGSRSDPELAEKLTPLLAQIHTRAQDQLAREFPRGPSLALLQLIVGAIRGLSIINVLNPGDEGVRGAIPLLQRLLRAGMDTGVFAARGDADPAPAARPPGKAAAKAGAKPAGSAKAKPASAKPRIAAADVPPAPKAAANASKSKAGSKAKPVATGRSRAATASAPVAKGKADAGASAATKAKPRKAPART